MRILEIILQQTLIIVKKYFLKFAHKFSNIYRFKLHFLVYLACRNQLLVQANFKISTFQELSVDELYQIMHLRQEVFVVEQNAAYLDADYKDPDSLHVQVLLDNTLIAYARILPPGLAYDEVSIGRVVSAPAWRRKKLGRPLMNFCLDQMEQHFQTRVCRISAQSYLVPFYSEFGFEVCSEEYLEDGLPHQEMLRK